MLDNISFIVIKGKQDWVFVGSNELSTTTLFNILTGNMEPDEGSYKCVTTSQAYFPKDSAAEFNREDTIVEWLTQYSLRSRFYICKRGFLGRMLFAEMMVLRRLRYFPVERRLDVLYPR